METRAPDTAAFYRRWAEVEADGSSPQYAALARAVAGSPSALALLDSLPADKRQPNLLLGALRWSGAPVHDPAAALRHLEQRAGEVTRLMRCRATQTNEVARCGALLPALSLLHARTGRPLALLELGASAGLCLVPERWSYRWRGPEHSTDLDGPTTSFRVDVTVTGPFPPPAMPPIEARLGIDATPVDLTDDEALRWLECLVWPEHEDRAQRLRAALSQLTTNPPAVRAGFFPQDVAAAVAELRAAAPAASVVVMHSAAAAYLDAGGRRRLAQVLADLGVHHLGLEGAAVSADLGIRGPAGLTSDHRFVLSLDAEVLATAHPHGRDLHWLAGRV
ncbi:DUF2332 domain-containing protein [Ruania suaedae]|uniref:DUF2332 domain-containing protein n=1 Tax=Ruania suaedae TaxID=2897774 RepID=UPI001E3A0D5F|nr:DUF2332 domain-containing protein [Ruania suaedae]UFU04456.1 DUF2332 domain-containing protein [Ruania suaedae]